MSSKRSKAVFLDRDGTLINERGYLADPSKIFFYPGAATALRRLQRAGFRLVIVTNQSGVGRGYFTLAQAQRVSRRFCELLRRQGVRIDRVYMCPHRPDAGCRCRKPNPFLARKAARELKIDLENSYMIGDQVRDLQLAKNAGLRGVLVLTGGGRAARSEAARIARKVASTIRFAASWIIEDAARSEGK